MKTYEQKDVKNLPDHIQISFLKKKLEIMIGIVKKAGLLLELDEFMNSDEVVKINLDQLIDIDELFVAFAKKYPDKFEIVQDKEGYDRYFYFSEESE